MDYMPTLPPKPPQCRYIWRTWSAWVLCFVVLFCFTQDISGPSIFVLSYTAEFCVLKHPVPRWNSLNLFKPFVDDLTCKHCTSPKDATIQHQFIKFNPNAFFFSLSFRLCVQLHEAMEQLEAALASADGSSQSWNEVYQHPKPSGSLKAYKKRFRLAQRIEKQALQSLNELELSRTSQAQAAQAATAAPPAAHDCGLASDVLEQYVAACGVDVDVGVGSLVLALNRLDTVTTLSSCSSIHVGAHEEEALVAFTASRTTAETRNARYERTSGPSSIRFFMIDSMVCRAMS